MPEACFTVNTIAYRPAARPLAVVCIDGCADEYLDASLDRDLMPRLKGMIARGYRGLARSALPSFTNVNNAGITTGVPPAVHGISGNYLLDPETGRESMLNSSRFLRCPTLLAAAAQAGRKVAFVTAKDKLREFLSGGLTGISFSAEKANQARLPTHGIEDVEQLVGEPTPPIYSPDASLYVLKAGVRLLETGRADFLYLSTTDYMQHAYGPTEPASLEFYAALDAQIGRLLDTGTLLGITADHGMNAKQTPEGAPRAIYLEEELKRHFNEGIRVILPITDPYVKHHGALGSYAVVHLPEGQGVAPVAEWLWSREGVTEVHDRDRAARLLQLPADRIGDLVVMSGRDVVLGRTPEHHDLSALESGLRSHGGRYEEMVPFLFSHPLRDSYQARALGDPRNFQVFDFVCNGLDHEPAAS